jgi:hypothetical protein
MAKKAVWVVIIVAVLAVGIFIAMQRSRMMSTLTQVSPGGLIAVSADGTPMSVPASAGKLPENTAMQESESLRVSLALNPYPPSVGQPSKFDVTLTDVNGKAIDDASISLDLTMPTMWMPPNQLTMEFISDGKYHAEGQFTMRGGWRIEVLITRGNEKQSVFFDVGM